MRGGANDAVQWDGFETVFLKFVVIVANMDFIAAWSNSVEVASYDFDGFWQERLARSENPRVSGSTPLPGIFFYAPKEAVAHAFR